MSVPAPDNLLRQLPTSFPTELVQVLAENAQVRIERIVSTGHASPPDFWYDQPEHEWVLVVQGLARLRLESTGVISLGPGDYALIPAGCKHRVEWTTPTEPTVWLAVFFAAP